jgi:hypothetical protein
MPAAAVSAMRPASRFFTAKPTCLAALTGASLDISAVTRVLCWVKWKRYHDSR